MSNHKQVKIGVVGCTGRGRHPLERLATLEDVPVVAIAAASQQARTLRQTLVCISQGGKVVDCPSRAHVATCVDAHPTWPTGRRLIEASRKGGSFRRQSVQIRCTDHIVAHVSEAVSAELISENEEDVQGFSRSERMTDVSDQCQTSGSRPLGVKACCLTASPPEPSCLVIPSLSALEAKESVHVLVAFT